MERPQLLGSESDANFVAWDGKVWRVPRALGPLDLDNDSHRARPGIAAYTDLEAARRGGSSAPAAAVPAGAVEITWWGHTDRRTPFVDGISSRIMRNLATGEELSSADLPIGACWPASPAEAAESGYPKGADGLTIFCKVPGDEVGHIWMIDGRASNCTMREDHAHRCWVRHGTIGDRLTVDKKGNTCQAGGGSIAVRGWHGFLRDGRLVT